MYIFKIMNVYNGHYGQMTLGEEGNLLDANPLHCRVSLGERKSITSTSAAQSAFERMKNTDAMMKIIEN